VRQIVNAARVRTERTTTASAFTIDFNQGRVFGRGFVYFWLVFRLDAGTPATGTQYLTPIGVTGKARRPSRVDGAKESCLRRHVTRGTRWV
jgi:hypothetical protein